jgi:hypothetical protein
MGGESCCYSLPQEEHISPAKSPRMQAIKARRLISEAVLGTDAKAAGKQALGNSWRNIAMVTDNRAPSANQDFR